MPESRVRPPVLKKGGGVCRFGGDPSPPGGGGGFSPALTPSLSPRRMPWQGDTNNMIDRFDVRAHLDYIPMYTPPLLNPM